MDRNQTCRGFREPGDETLDALRLSPQMEGALDVMRFYFTSFAQPESQAWIGALEWSVATAGPTLGSRVAYQAMRLVQALRGSRTAPFRFSNPCCPTCRKIVTETERRLLMLIVHLQRNELSSAHAEAMLICEGHDAGRLLVEAETLSRILQPGAANARVDVFH
ncbi:MAG: hypothetical protein AAFU61_01030 [Pseudomonadota bacterium]